MSQTTPAAAKDNSARKIESCATPRQKAISTNPIWSRVDRRAVTANKRYQISRGFRTASAIARSFAPDEAGSHDGRYRSQLSKVHRHGRRRDPRAAQIEQTNRWRAAEGEHRRIVEPPGRGLIGKALLEILNLGSAEQRIGVHAALAEPRHRLVQPLLIQQVKSHSHASAVIADRATVQQREDDAVVGRECGRALRGGDIRTLGLPE